MFFRANRAPLSLLIAGLLAAVVATILATVLATVVVVPAGAAPASAPNFTVTATPGPQVINRSVVFSLQNTAYSLLPCAADNRTYQVRARLVGPRGAVLARDASPRINVLVHDAGTGGWFWNLRSKPGFDYATRLAARGETSLVLDRLGYDRSPLADGDKTCLDAQAFMLHQVVQHLYSGVYDFAKGDASPPHASQVVVHGHGVGAAIAEREAAKYHDTVGLVLMSWAGNNLSQVALAQAQQQTATCLTGAGYAPFGSSKAAYRRLLFTTAPRPIQRVALRLRNSTPCGDVTSLASTLLSSSLSASQVEVPVLVLQGSKDTRVREVGTTDPASAFSSSAKVVTRTIRGAGSALPLEKSAPQTRAAVLRWLKNL